jgi:hypothetical protein
MLLHKVAKKKNENLLNLTNILLSILADFSLNIYAMSIMRTSEHTTQYLTCSFCQPWDPHLHLQRCWSFIVISRYTIPQILPPNGPA